MPWWMQGCYQLWWFPRLPINKVFPEIWQHWAWYQSPFKVYAILDMMKVNSMHGWHNDNLLTSAWKMCWHKYTLWNRDAGVGTDGSIWIFLKRQTWHLWQVHVYHLTSCSSMGHQNWSRRCVQTENSPLCPKASWASCTSTRCLISGIMILCFPCESHFHNLSSKMKNLDTFFVNCWNWSSFIPGGCDMSCEKPSIIDSSTSCLCTFLIKGW